MNPKLTRTVLPGVYFSQRFPLGKYVAVVVFLWGGVTVCTVAVNTYQGLLVQRFFLGVAEAGIAPAFSLITAMWYKRQEQPLRYAIWYSSVGMGTLLGTLLLYAIGQINGPLSSWRYQFMIIGSISAVWGIALWFLLPDSPLTAYFLSKEQKVVAVERMRWEQSGIENKTVKMDQVKEAFTDPKTWFYVLATFLCNFTNGAVTGFGSIIVKSFGVCFFPLQFCCYFYSKSIILNQSP
jgi:MFS family permease